MNSYISHLIGKKVKELNMQASHMNFITQGLNKYPYFLFCTRLCGLAAYSCHSISDCKKFKDTVEDIAEKQGKNEEKESEEASSAAELVEKLTVTEAKKEESADKEEAPAADDKDVKE